MPGDHRSKKKPVILSVLEELVAPETAGDPMTAQKWVRSSLRTLSVKLEAAGHVIDELLGIVSHRLPELLPLVVQEVQHGLYDLVPKKPLGNGEYVIGTPIAYVVVVADFTIQASASGKQTEGKRK